MTRVSPFRGIMTHMSCDHGRMPFRRTTAGHRGEANHNARAGPAPGLVPSHPIAMQFRGRLIKARRRVIAPRTTGSAAGATAGRRESDSPDEYQSAIVGA